MPDRDTTGSPPDATERRDEFSAERYEPPQIEDLDTPEGPSVTAAGFRRATPPLTLSIASLDLPDTLRGLPGARLAARSRHAQMLAARLGIQPRSARPVAPPSPSAPSSS